jgi:transposase
VQRPTMHFVSIKTPKQMDLLALHRVRSRLVKQRTGVANQIRGFLLERGITVRQGFMPLRKALSWSVGARPRSFWLDAALLHDAPPFGGFRCNEGAILGGVHAHDLGAFRS